LDGDGPLVVYIKLAKQNVVYACTVLSVRRSREDYAKDVKERSRSKNTKEEIKIRVKVKGNILWRLPGVMVITLGEGEVIVTQTLQVHTSTPEARGNVRFL
jgi:hypothetical protein